MTRTFAHRKTAVTPQPVAFTAAFANDPIKQTQWKGFLRKSRIDIAPQDLPAVIEVISGFQLPLAGALAAGQEFTSIRHPPGPWQNG